MRTQTTDTKEDEGLSATRPSKADYGTQPAGREMRNPQSLAVALDKGEGPNPPAPPADIATFGHPRAALEALRRYGLKRAIPFSS